MMRRLSLILILILSGLGLWAQEPASTPEHSAAAEHKPEGPKEVSIW